MTWIRNFLYLAVLICLGPALAIARRVRGKGLRSWPSKFFGSVPDECVNAKNSAQVIWFHAVSVGEINLVATLVARFKTRYPDHRVLISTSTDSGFELATAKFDSSQVFYFPWDFTWAVNRVLKQLKPSCLVLAELEIWPNLIHAANTRNIPIVLANGRMSDRSLAGYRQLRWVTGNVFQQLSAVAVQSELDRRRFEQLGASPERIFVTGSIKFDGVLTERSTPRTRQFRELTGLEEMSPVFLAGSTQAGEDEVVLEAWQTVLSAIPQLRLMIAPRHPHRAEKIARMIQSLGKRPVRRSQLESPLEADDVLIIDSIGELADWWGLAQAAFVGGSLGDRGGQNMLEPLAKRCATSFGPNTRNFRQVVQVLLERRLATVVHDSDQLAQFVRQSFEQPEREILRAEQATQLIEQHQGATDATIELLGPILRVAPSHRDRNAA